VREAVEFLVQAHGEVLKEQCAGVDPADIYRAAVRVVMRMVVVLFAESRELLPQENALYHGSYGLAGLLEELEKAAARGGNRLSRSWNA
jgi:methanogenic corrinoid protein MtbC1